MSRESITTAWRSEEILQELLRNGEVSVESLAKHLQVSAATIRRDLGELERQGLLRRNDGGGPDFRRRDCCNRSGHHDDTGGAQHPPSQGHYRADKRPQYRDGAQPP